MPKSIPARIVFWQFAIGIAAALLFGLGAGPREGFAAFAGGAIGAVLSLYFAIRVFGARRRDEPPQAVLRKFFRAEMMKILMAAGLFTLAAVIFAEAWLPLLVTFVASQTVYGFALLWNAGDGY